MRKTLDLLLQLESLALIKKGLDLAGPRLEMDGLEGLRERIVKLRRQVPGRVLSLYDALAHRYADPLAALVEGTCQGCHQPVARASRNAVSHSLRLRQCNHCERLLFVPGDAPDYVA